MEGHTATVTCPNCNAGCATAIPVPGRTVLQPWRLPAPPEPEELTCRTCGWEFVANSADVIEDDGGADLASPIIVGPDGELGESPDVPCPHCSQPLGVDGEPGPVRCPHCQRTTQLLWSDRRETPVPEVRGRASDWLPDREPDDLWDYNPYDEDGESSLNELECPNGCEFDECDGPELRPLADGRVWCRDCGVVFHDPAMCGLLLEYDHHGAGTAERVVARPDDLEAAFHRVRPDGTVRLAAGRYSWPDNAFPPGACITGGPNTGAVVITDPVDIPFGSGRLVGLEFAKPVTVTSANVHFERCRFLGGLTVAGATASVWVRRCQLDAVTVRDLAAVRLLRSTVSGGPGDGVRVIAGGWVSLDRCEVTGNAGHGIAAGRHCGLFLRRSTVSGNAGVDVALAGRSVVRRSQVGDVVLERGSRSIWVRTETHGDWRRERGARVRRSRPAVVADRPIIYTHSA